MIPNPLNCGQSGVRDLFQGAVIHPEKVAVYIRWSTDEQGEGSTLAIQREACTAYAVSQGWVVRDELVFVDDGWSGGNMERPALARLRRTVQAGLVDCVVVYKIDRLSRNVVEMVQLVLQEWDGRCYVKSARENIDTTQQQGKMFFYLLTSFAEWERSTIRERTHAGKQKRAQAGYFAGSARPYGYARGETPGSVVVAPHEADVVRMIYSEYVKGRGANGIAKWLNTQGIRSRTGGFWREQTVWQILRNPAYLGISVWGACTELGRSRRPGQPRRVRNPEPKVVVENAWVPLVDSETWHLVQTIMKEKPVVGPGQAPRALQAPALLTGLAVCAGCGSGIKYRKPQGAHKHGDYLCMGRHRKGTAYCTAAFMAAPLVDRIVVDKLLNLYGDRVQREAYMAAFTRELTEQTRAVGLALQAVEQRAAGLEAEDARMRREYRAQRLTIAEYRRLLGDLEQDHRELQQERERLAARLQELQALGEAQRGYLQPLADLDRWHELGDTGRKQILRRFVKTIRLIRRSRPDPVEVEIVWRIDWPDRVEVQECILAAD